MKGLRRSLRPVAIGAATLIGVLTLYLAFGRSDAEQGRYQVTAYFTKAIGLFPNSDVAILGVPVGQVESVEPIGSQVKVVMSIDSRYKVPAGATAQIVPISVISDRYVQLAPVYDGGPALGDGSEIPVENTFIPAELDDVFKQLKKLLDAIEPGRAGEPGALGDLIVQLDRSLRDREDELRGTLITGSTLTSTLAEAQEDISGLLINLNDLFGRLATRANSFGTLNRNLALVMAALAESRNDIEGTLVNLADMTGEVASLVRQHGDRLGRDVGLAARITRVLLKSRGSVEEALEWLPVVGEGLDKAFNREFRDIDIRDNANAKLECEILKPLPRGPIKEALRERCTAETGEPDRPRGARSGTSPRAAPAPGAPGKLDCDRGVRRVKSQLARIEEVALGAAVLNEVVRPLQRQLDELKKKCREMGAALAGERPATEPVEEVGGMPDVDQPRPPGARGLTGSAASTALPGTYEPGPWERFGTWLGGFLAYLGVNP